jgi:hypothetical protein
VHSKSIQRRAVAARNRPYGPDKFGEHASSRYAQRDVFSIERLGGRVDPGDHGVHRMMAEHELTEFRFVGLKTSVRDIKGAESVDSSTVRFDAVEKLSSRLARTVGRCGRKKLPTILPRDCPKRPRGSQRRAVFPIVLCRDRQVSGLLKQPPKLRLWSQAHGSIRVQKGTPLPLRLPTALSGGSVAC